MGKPVTIDTDDVEVLLNAAAAIRHVENALEAVRNDPAMQRIYKSGKIGQALDRCNRARAQAMKDEPVGPPPDWEPTDYEAMLLRRLLRVGIDYTEEPRDYANLRRYGFVVMGQVNKLIIWGDKTEEAIPEPEQAAKLTQAGKQWAMADQQKKIGAPQARELPMLHPGRSEP